MAEKRKHDRIIVKGKVGGRVVLASEIDILDLSLGGVHFTCTKRIMTNSICTINLQHKDRVIDVKGKVVRSSFIGTKRKKLDNVPIYEVAMEFPDLPEHKLDIIKKIIESIGHD